MNELDLKKLNTATKYPSIPTYHERDPKTGQLLENPVKFKGEVIMTEKIDGTNVRIIFLPDDFFIIGSRKELLFAKGDLFGDPSLGIVEKMRSCAEKISFKTSKETLTIFYFELFGGKMTAGSKQYTSNQQIGYRLLDIAIIEDYNTLFNLPIEQIASWREKGGQTFFWEKKLLDYADFFNFSSTPRIAKISSDRLSIELPTVVSEGLPFLKKTVPYTLCLLDKQGKGGAEGLVLRTLDRSCIAKMKFRDYQKK